MGKLIQHSWKITLLVGLSLCLSACDQEIYGVLNPKGIIAFQERQLLFDSLALMSIVVLTVIIMSIVFVYRYHESHDARDYRPEWHHSVLLESIWWGVPIAIILILSIMTWQMTHKLDPYNKIDVQGKLLEIQVVALPWKWLFLYKDQNLATVNVLTIPKGRQVHFFLTSDNVPMSAFFIPQLGSQIYTMAGMQSQLHLLATHKGTFVGLNSQYNGDGFSDMHFDVNVVDDAEFKRWSTKIKQSASPLTQGNYQALRKQSVAHKVSYYSKVKTDLFKSIIKSYKAPIHPA